MKVTIWRQTNCKFCMGEATCETPTGWKVCPCVKIVISLEEQGGDNERNTIRRNM